MTDQLHVGDQARMRRRGGAVVVTYRIDQIDELPSGQRMIYLEALTGRQRTAAVWPCDGCLAEYL